MRVNNSTLLILILCVFFVFNLSGANAQSNQNPSQEIKSLENDSDLVGFCGFHKKYEIFLQQGLTRSALSKEKLISLGKMDTEGNIIEDYVGQQVDFWTWNFKYSTVEQIQATCKAVGSNCYIYVHDIESINQTTIDAIKNEFDLHIYPTDRAHFGSEWKPGIDGDDKVTILIYNIKDNYYYGSGSSYIAGYFDPYDETTNYQSNQREMFYMDCNPATPGSNQFYGTLAHEFQHMIHFNEDGNEETWINEGCSGYAEFICGYGWRKPSHFFTSPDNQLTLWSQTLDDYEQTFLFILYLYEKYGGAPSIKALVQESANGISGVEIALSGQGYSTPFNNIFTDWIAANFLDDTSIGTGQYGYSNIDLSSYPISFDNSHGSYPASSSGSVNKYASDYIQFTNGASASFDYTGPVSGLLLKLGSTQNAVESITGTKSVPDFGSTYSQIVLVAQAHNSSGGYSYTVTTQTSEDKNLRIYSGTGANNSFTYDTASHVCSFNTSVENSGSETVNHFYVGYYLSTDNIVDPGDYLVTSADYSNLPGGQYTNLTGTIDLDNFSLAELPAGTYYAGVYIDYLGEVDETDEDDNTWVDTGTINWTGPSSLKPNLTIYTGSGSDNSFSFNSSTGVINFSSSIINNGSDNSSSFRIGWYLSIDQNINTSDKLITSEFLAGLNKDANINITGSKDLDEICDQIPVGTYYAGAVIDYNDQVAESNEFDNDHVWTSPTVTWNGCDPGQTIQVSIDQDLTCGCNNGDTFVAAVKVEDVTGEEIYAYGFDLLFNSGDLEVTGVSSDGTITSGWGAPTQYSSTGMVTIASAGSSVLSGSGTLVKITFRAVKNHTDGEFVNLNFQNFLFNEGSPIVSTSNGKVTFSCSSSLVLSGSAKYYTGSPELQDVKIDISGGLTNSVMTNASGFYEFSNLVSGANYQLTASKPRNSQTESAISTFDASYALRFWASLITLNEEQKIAADVSGNGEITAFDASIILRYYVGQDVSQYEVAKWKFVVPPVTNWLSPTTIRSYTSLSSSQTNQNFNGILIGDITGNYSGSMLAKAGDGTVVPGEMRSLTGNMLELPIRIEGVSSYSAVGFELKINNSALKVENVSLARENEQVLLAFHEQNGTLRVAVAGAVELKDTDLLNIVFKKKTGANNNDIKITLMNYEIDAKRVDSPQEWLVAVEKLPEQFDLKQNYPNPFNPSTKICYSVAEKSSIKLVIYNTIGQKVRELVNLTQIAGNYEILWDGRDEIGKEAPSGIYIVQFETDTFNKAVKIVKTK
ncbi:T9SS type A sorting domain-containing protein [candidate division KSB1 bacterium]|nr:T9SS type A sorting domain-containing protein [candidate division KSB1 bacterium]